MPRTVTKSVFQYDELTDKAKENAREWYRRASDGDNHFAEHVYDDAVAIAALFGLTISTRIEKYHVMGTNGKPGRDGQRERTNIYYTGFSSQGDGACYEGDYEFKADAMEAVKAYAPTDERLHSIVEDLQCAQARAGNRVKFNIKHSGHYYHEHSMNMEVLDSCYQNEEGDQLPESEWLTHEQTKDVAEALIRFANWIYRELESAYEYENSDENVSETIRINEYEFEADGSRTND